MPIPTKEQPIARVSARDRVYNTLQEWIIDGTLEPNEPIKDADLAKYFGVSRTPVREAIQKLIDQKLVISVPSSGTYVAPIDMNDISYIYQTLAGMQAFSIELGIENATSEDIEKLSYYNNQFMHFAKLSQSKEMVAADSDFHMYLAEMTGNPYIISMTEQLLVHVQRSEIKYFSDRDDYEESVKSHNNIVLSIRENRLEDAKKYIHENWRLTISNN